MATATATDMLGPRVPTASEAWPRRLTSGGMAWAEVAKEGVGTVGHACGVRRGRAARGRVWFLDGKLVTSDSVKVLLVSLSALRRVSARAHTKILVTNDFPTSLGPFIILFL